MAPVSLFVMNELFWYEFGIGFIKDVLVVFLSLSQTSGFFMHERLENMHASIQKKSIPPKCQKYAL
jgi:hypothetical protein